MAAGNGLVGVVFVSHSSKIAEGLVDVARQMAPRTALYAAGGTDDDEIGTSFAKVVAGITEADGGAGVVILCDLGSAILTAETALDFLDDEARGRTRIANAPLVEGGVAAAVAAEIGGDLDAVVEAAQSAVAVFSAAPTSPAATQGAAADGTVTRTVTLINADGLHARPAAEFARLAGTFAARVVANGRDATSLLSIMALGLTKGMDVEISASGAGAGEAVDALAGLVESGFGEA